MSLRRVVQALTSAALLVAVVAAPAPADASYAQVYQKQLSFSGFPHEVNDVLVSGVGNEVTIKDSAKVNAGPGCEQIAPDAVRCNVEQSVLIFTEDQNDRVTFDRSMISALPKHVGGAWIDTGPGDDEIAVSAPPTLSADTPLTAVGGPGADDISARGAVVDYSSVNSGGVNVTLDGVANDGNLDDESGGRRDNVGAGSSVRGTDFGDRLVGDTGANTLNGGPGDDAIIGGKGRDILLGFSGDDTIDARDGQADVVGCAYGTDSARTDSLNLDSVSRCEHIDALAGLCAPLDRFTGAHSHPKRFGAPSRPKRSGLYVGKTSFGLPVRLNVSGTGRAFVPASRITYKWCYGNRPQQVDVKISHDPIRADGSFDIVHHGLKRIKNNRTRRIVGRFYDHGRKVSGVITDDWGQKGHGGPVTFAATLTPRS